MISNELRGLIASMRAHVDAETMSKGFFSVFEERLRGLATDIEEMERASVPAHLKGQARAKPCLQLSLIDGGKS